MTSLLDGSKNKDTGVKRQYIGRFAACLFAGLLTAQIIATLQVTLSNNALLHTLKAIDDAGYLAVPNGWIIGKLHSFTSALYGGLFFTVSVGAGVSLLSCAAIGLWDAFFCRNRLCLMIGSVLWAGCLLLTNLNGFSPLASAYFVVIPPVVFLISRRLPSPEISQTSRFFKVLPFLPLALLACLWGFASDGHPFLNLRDNLLLRNSVGIKLNDFYYDYSFYPAEAIKPLDQRILKTCNLDRVMSPSKKLLEHLLSRDYLNISGNGDVDLLIKGMGETLVFEHKGSVVLKVSVHEFMGNASKILEEFSFKTDRYGFFRRFCFFSVLVGFPLVSYVFLYAVLGIMFQPFLGWRVSRLMTSTCCFLSGLLLLMAVYGGMHRNPAIVDWARVLSTGSPRERVSVLRSLANAPMEDASGFAAYGELRKSPYIPDRYWLAKALGNSRRPETRGDLLELLDDASPNVVSMAFFSLGRIGDKGVAPEILKRIKSSRSWYNQWYAYRALRSLGWTQTKSL